jgi:hypothetical protein
MRVGAVLNSIDDSIQVSRKFTLIAAAVSNLAFSGRTPQIKMKERVGAVKFTGLTQNSQVDPAV